MTADRDHILEQALKHELRAEDATSPHLDAETVAAWQDGALDAAQMSAAEAHAASCPRCQAMLAAFARGTVGTFGTPGTPGTRFPWWKFALAPLAAGAAAVTLWMVVPEQQQIATRPAAPPAAVAVDKTQPKDFKPTEAQTQAAAARVRELEAAGVRDSAANKLSVEAPRADRQQLKEEETRKEDAAIAQAARPAAVAAPMAAPQPPPPAPMPAAPPAAAEAKAGERGALLGDSDLRKSARLAFIEVSVPTLDRNIRWRAYAGRIERSSDGGTTWTLLRERPDQIVTAGSSPTTSVAWFAGRGGFVAVTIDAGATFTDISLAEPLDIASVSATDAQTAVISTVTGRRFRTEDRGRTWLPF